MDVSKETEDVLDAAPSEKGSPTKNKAPAKKAVAKKGNKKPGPSATAGTAMKNTKTGMVAQKKPPPKKAELIPDEVKDNVPKESPAKPAPQNASPGRNTRNRAARNTNSTVSENNSSGTSQGDDGSKETQEDSANLGDKKKGQGDSNSNLGAEKETQENISANLSGEKETQENISANLSGEKETQENSSANFDVRRGSLRNQNAKDTTLKKAVGERKIPSKPETPPAGGKKQLESKPASDKLKDSTTLVGKKVSQNAPNLGEKKLTSNFGSLMASFFSRQLDDVASSPDKTSKDTDDKKEGQSQDDKEASTLNVGQPKQAARPGNQNQSLPKKDDTDEVSIIEIDQRKRSSGLGALLAGFGKRQNITPEASPSFPAPGNKRATKEPSSEKAVKIVNEDTPEDQKVPVMKRVNEDKPKEKKDPVKKKQSPDDDVSQAENEQRKVSSSIGALMAGFGNRQPPSAKSPQTFSSPGRGRRSANNDPSPVMPDDGGRENEPVEKKSRVPEEKAKNNASKDGKTKKDSSNEDDSNQENEQRKVSSSIGALMAGFGNRQPPSAKSPQTFSSPGRGRRSTNNDPSPVMPDDGGGENEPVEKKSRVPEEKAKNNASKDGKTKKDSSNEDDSNRENEQRKVSGSIGALLAGLGNRQWSGVESSQPISSPGNRRKSVTNDPSSVKPDDGGENRPVEKIARRGPEEKANDNSFIPEVKAENNSSKDGKTKKNSSNDDYDGRENEQRKMSNSIGALLGGLGNRQRSSAESPQIFSSPGNRRTPVTSDPWSVKPDDGGENRPVEKKARGGSEEKTENDSSKDWEMKEDSSKDWATKKDSSKDGKTKKDSSNDDDGNRENEQRRVSSSIGALLAGLGNRQSLAAESSQPFSSPGNRRKSVTNDPSSVKPDDDENQSVEKKASRGTEEKAENDSFLPEEKAENDTSKDWKTKKDSSNDDDDNRGNEQRRVSSSIGALLAGLGNRQRSSTESHQPFSSPGNRRNSVTNDPSSVKPDDGDGNRPVEKRARRGPEENAENNSFLPEEKAEKDSSNNDDSSHENEEILNGDPLATKASHPLEAKITHPLPPSQEKSLFETDSVGGRLTLFKNKWRRSSWGHNVVKNGVSWKWKENKPKVQLFPQRSNRFLNDTVASLLDEGVVEKAPFIAFQLRLRQNTDIRSEIFDLSTLNKYIECPYFKMTTIEHVREVLPQGAWAISLELKEAYFHVPINKSFRKFLGFKIGDQKYHLKALPIGLNVAPMVLTRLTTHIVEMLQNQKIEVVVCLDDWLVWGDSIQACSRARDIVMNRLGEMGFCINLSKSQLIPKQNFEWLGVMWNTRSTEIALPSNEIVSTKNLAFCNQPEGFHCEQRKLSSSIGALLAGFSNRQHPAPESSQPFSSSGDENRPMQKRSVGPEGNKEGDSSKDGETTSSMKEFSDYDNHGREKYVETKKTNSIGSLLAGLGSRQQEFCNDDQETSSSGGFRGRGRGRGRGGERFDSNRGHGDAQRGNRGFGDFGFVSDKFQRDTNKRTFEEFEHDLLQSSDDNSRRDEPVVKEEGDIVYVRGHIPQPKLTEKELENQKKSLDRNLTFEEEAEKRKETGIGAMLASLANRTFPDPPPSAPRRGERDGGGFNGRRGRGGDDNRRGGRGFRKRGYEEDYDDDRGSKRFRDQDWDDDDRGDRRRWDRDDGKRGRKEKEPFDPKKAAEEMKSEIERLEKEHGPGVFTVGFTEARVMAYVCEICCVQLNKQTLEAHANGMQHLKKKNLYEKKKRLQALNKDDGKPKYSGGRTGWTKVDPAASKSGPSTPKLTPSTTPAPPPPPPAPDNGSGDGVYGYDGGYGQDGYDYNNQYYMQQQPSYGPGYMEMGPTGGYMMGPPTGNKNTTDWTNSQYSAGQMNTPAQAVPTQAVPTQAVPTQAVPTQAVPTQAVPSQISTPVAPPPPPVTEAAPKPKPAKGGATVSLLQRLDACAVKNEKDLELASNVISALLKSLKEFNHKRGDTKFIEVLTEIDIKFRSLKPKVSSHVKSSKDVSAVSSKAYTSSAPQSAYATYSSSDASKYDNTLKNSPGTWYSQGRGNNPSSSYAQGQAVKPTSALEAVASNYSSKATGGYASQAAPKTSATGYAAPQGVKASSYAAHGTSVPPGYSAHSNYYSTSYPGPATAGSKQTDNKEQSLVKSTSKDAEYYTRPPPATQGEYRSYSSKTGNNSVMEIIRSGNEPPPPPPPDTAPNYAGQGYQTGYYNTSAPPPQYNQQQY